MFVSSIFTMHVCNVFIKLGYRLQPLLAAVKKDPTTIAMGMLDYINSKSLEYRVSPGFTRYGFDWRLIFFETYFRPDQIGPAKEDPRP